MIEKRCGWCGDNPLYVKYHDEEWGKPVHDDGKLFEFLILETNQAGLSWITVLKKREAMREAYCGFNPEKVAAFTEEDKRRLMSNPNIIRNGRKIDAAVRNAKRFLEIQNEFGSFDRYIWGFTDYKQIKNLPEKEFDVPASTPLSEKISKDLIGRGFGFVGPVIVYSYMQAIGMVNDHVKDCSFA